MRRLLAIHGLVCALALGAWGHVLTSQVCAHAAASPAVAINDDACCHAGGAQQTAHNAAAQQMHAHVPASSASCCQANIAAVAASEFSLDQFGAACAHCVGRSAPAPLLTDVCGAQTTKRAAIGPAIPVRLLVTPAPLCALASAPPQHAPPIGARRHLLLNIFLI